jgi:hypothetical protein
MTNEQIINIFKEQLAGRGLETTGYLRLTITGNYIEWSFKEKESYGEESYRSAFHPNGICEGKGICIHCGCTLFNLIS